MRPSKFLLVLLCLPSSQAFAQDEKRTSEPARYSVVLQSPRDLQSLLSYLPERMPLLSAHRGGPPAHLPENSIAAFDNALQHSFAMLEIDPRITRDGEIVIHHDASLERTTNGTGPVASKTLAELKQLRLKDRTGKLTNESIPTLDEVLMWARGRTIVVLDQKDVSAEARVRKIEQHSAEAFAIVIVYSFQEAKTCFALNRNIMMEVMIPDQAKFEEFDRTGIPWKNVIAFVGHTPPEDRNLLQFIHDEGSLCMAGTSRNLDKQLAAVKDVRGAEQLAVEYESLLESGVDVIETDVPCELGKLLFHSLPTPEPKSKFLIKR